MVQDILDSWHADQASLQVEFILSIHSLLANLPFLQKARKFKEAEGWGKTIIPATLLKELQLWFLSVCILVNESQ